MALRGRIFRADLILLLLAAVWGSGFIAQKWAMVSIGPLTFVTIRLMLGSLVLLPLFFLRKRCVTALPASRRKLIAASVLLIVMVFLGTWLQQKGLVTTEVGTAGFITGLYVVFTPLLGLFVGYIVRPTTWFAITAAVAGLFLLTVAGKPEINRGDLLVLLSAIAWGGQVLLVGWLVLRMHSVALTFMQLSGAALLSLILTPWFEDTTWALVWEVRWELLFSGVVASGLAFLMQAWAQRDAPPAHAAILISMEAVFAVLFGWWLLAERLTAVQLWGCGLMLMAIVIAEVKPPRPAFAASPLEATANPPPAANDQQSL